MAVTPLGLAHLFLHAHQVGAFAEFDVRGEGGQVDLFLGVVDGGDALDAHGDQLAGDLLCRQPAVVGLAAGHGDGVVEEDLVGDVGACGEGGADRLHAGMVVGAVAEVLEDVAAFGEGCLADPVRALAAHMGEAQRLAVHPLHHVVTADAGIGAGAVGDLGRGIVRAAGAEPGLALGDIRRVVGLERLRQAGAAGGEVGGHDAFAGQQVAQLVGDLDRVEGLP